MQIDVNEEHSANARYPRAETREFASNETFERQIQPRKAEDGMRRSDRGMNID
jgi:hypothetical protein